MTINHEAQKLEASWKEEARWQGIERPYSAEDVLRLVVQFRSSILLPKKEQNVCGSYYTGSLCESTGRTDG